MDWDARYLTSRSLSIAISPSGKLVATNSISRPAQEIDLDGLPVLIAFAGGATPRQVLERLGAEWEVEEAGFGDAVEGLLAQNLLTPADGTGEPALAASGFASPWGHHYMLRDALRVDAYRAAIERYCAGRRVLEIGCGTGILSLFAARAGASRVDAIEESEIAAAAAELIAANPWADRMELHRGNSRDVELGEPAEILIHELFGTDPFEENLLPALADAKSRLLTPGARFLPARLEVACVGIDTVSSGVADAGRALVEARAYAERSGLDLAPWLARLAEPEPRGQRKAVAEKEIKPLTAECPLYSIDFAEGDLTAPPPLAEPILEVREAGSLGALLIFFRARFDDEILISTAPDAPKTHWGHDLRLLPATRDVRPGEEIRLAASLESAFGRQRLRLEIA
ncbi:MAG TPA: 50S ribosomal protein L11 methyltransferase [Thermoanaerobaculia bacterium]|nr:50S ribosomal protein L11 methyltransferase [Thermoanaerobaculia bacterium]